MSSPDPGIRAQTPDEPAAARRLAIDAAGQTGASGCCTPVLDSAALALVDFLSRDLAAGPEPTRAWCRRTAPWRRPATARSVIFLFMEGGPSHIDTFDPKPELNRLAGQAAAAELQARDHADGRRPRAAPGIAAEVEAARPEWDLGFGLAPAHRDVRRRPGGDPIVLVQRA